jgi:predicted nucleic acid-binding protein
VRPVVVDASVVVKWFVDDVLTEQAVATLDRFYFHAPSLILAEQSNALWKYARRGDLSAVDCGAAAKRLPRLVRLTPMAELAEEAAALAVELDHPAYDCFYLCLAETLGYDLLSADKRMLSLARDRLGLETIPLDSINPEPSL